jgi:hypothetical protein
MPAGLQFGIWPGCSHSVMAIEQVSTGSSRSLNSASLSGGLSIQSIRSVIGQGRHSGLTSGKSTGVLVIVFLPLLVLLFGLLLLGVLVLGLQLCQNFGKLFWLLPACLGIAGNNCRIVARCYGHSGIGQYLAN